jgi:membrane-associated phospholipid phosphatase
MIHLVHAVTDLGDAAVVVPASAMLLAYLLYVRSTKTASIWVATLVLCAGLTIFAKLALYTCGTVADLRSPSGHTSVSVTFYGCCALMMSADKDRRNRLLLMLGGTAIAAAIAMSRVLLHAHTIGEVVAGFIIGAFCVAWFAAGYFAQPSSPRLRWEPGLVMLVLVVLAMHGRHWTLEAPIAHLARLLHADMRFCV